MNQIILEVDILRLRVSATIVNKLRIYFVVVYQIRDNLIIFENHLSEKIIVEKNNFLYLIDRKVSPENNTEKRALYFVGSNLIYAYDQIY